MLRIFIFFWGYFSTTVFAAGAMVYMVEEGGSKQIALNRVDGSPAKLLTSGTDWHLYPEIDASGTKVAFVEGKNDRILDIALLDLKTGQKETLTASEGRHLHPDFSGDGRFLAYSVQYGSEKPVIVVNELGQGGMKLKANTREVIPSDSPAYFPAVSFKGDFIVFQRTKDRGKKDIALYRRGIKGLRVLSDPEGVSMSPSLSWDDRFVAYTSQVDGNWDIYAKELATERVYRITDDAAEDFAPSFRSDGSIVFASNRHGKFEIFSVKADWAKIRTPKAKLIASAKGDLYAPSVSVVSETKTGLLPLLPEPARSSFGVVRVKDKLYMVGGHQGEEHTYPPESFSAELWIFDMRAKTWKVGAPRPRASHGFSLAKWGRYVYAFGGFAYSSEHKPRWRSLDEIDRYDTETDKWETIGKLPRPRSSNVVAQVGSKVYLIGGWDATPKKENDYDGRFHPEVDVFDLAKESATESALRLPAPLRRAFSGVVSGQKIYLVGGLGEGATHFELLANVTELDTSTGKFTEFPELPFATFAPAAGMIGRRLWVFGGMFKTGPQDFVYVDDIYFHALGTAGWAHSQHHLSEPKGFSQVIRWSRDTVGILGGHSSTEKENAPVRTFETFSVR